MALPKEEDAQHGGEEPKALVLIVDDEESIRATLSDVLEDEHYQTITAADGMSALEQVRTYSPQVVFLDIWMPGWDGIETLERIKEVAPNTEVIIVSGHATISNALEATKRGAFDFIEKPLDIEGVTLAAQRALEHWEHNKGRVVAGLNDQAVEVSPESNTPVLIHQGAISQGLAGRDLGQRTLRTSVVLYGHCLHSGKKSGLVLEPLPPSSGVHFAKIGDSRTVPAFVDYVESANFATTIRSGTVSAATIEHLLAALHAYGITNLLVKCNGEVPIFDGSSKEFCRIIEEVGVEEQEGSWFEIAPDQRIEVKNQANESEFVSIEPAEALSISYELLYPKPVGRQFYEFEMKDVSSFKNEISSARTFGFMKDVEKLQKSGLAAGGRLDNFILIGDEEVINTELRFEDELVRHKILDILGDFFLLGRPIRGRIQARMSGHSDNVNLLKQLRNKVLEQSMHAR